MTETMIQSIKEFKQLWETNFSFVSMELSDSDISGHIKVTPTIAIAVEIGVDWCLANGLSEVQE